MKLKVRSSQMNFEEHKIDQGKIIIAFSDKNLSVGTLTLNPKTDLAKHNRPVLESLFQVKGKCMVEIFDSEGKTKEVVLNEGESIDIEPETFHKHSNPYEEESITFWKASGDITEIIDAIRSTSRM
jgi:quercetin dioxygenase-like cupin family protein